MYRECEAVHLEMALEMGSRLEENLKTEILEIEAFVKTDWEIGADEVVE